MTKEKKEKIIKLFTTIGMALLGVLIIVFGLFLDLAPERNFFRFIIAFLGAVNIVWSAIIVYRTWIKKRKEDAIENAISESKKEIDELFEKTVKEMEKLKLLYKLRVDVNVKEDADGYIVDEIKQAASKAKDVIRQFFVEFYNDGENRIENLLACLEKIKFNDIHAQFELGRYYEEGLGVKQCHIKAFKWYEKAAKNGHGDAQHNLAICYHHGEGIEKDMGKAMYWYTKAANNTHANASDAQHDLGKCYQNGDGVEKNIEQMVFWFEKAANAGHVLAQYDLACYYFEEGVHYRYKKRDYSLSVIDDFRLFHEYQYKNQDLSHLNIDKAMEWSLKAAEQGYADAQFLYSRIISSRGKDFSQRNNLLEKWLREAAAGGNIEAQCTLGMFYNDLENYHSSYDWLEKAANSGHIFAMLMMAQYYLGATWENEKLLPLPRSLYPSFIGINHKEALWWVKKAALSEKENAVNGFFRVIGLNSNQPEGKYSFDYYKFDLAVGEAHVRLGQYLASWIGGCDYAGAIESYTAVLAFYEKWIQDNIGDTADIIYACKNMSGLLLPLGPGNIIRAIRGIISCYYEQGNGLHNKMSEHAGNIELARPFFEKAIEWYERYFTIVNEGYSNMCYRLGRCYYNLQNYPKAVEIWEKHKNIPTDVVGYDCTIVIKIQYELGKCYEEGKGVIQDYLKAKEYFEKAAAPRVDNGGTIIYQEAVDALERVSKKLH